MACPSVNLCLVPGLGWWLEAEGLRLGAGGWGLEAGVWRLDVGGWMLRGWRVGGLRQGAGYLGLEAAVLLDCVR